MAKLNEEILQSLLGESDRLGYELPDAAAMSRFSNQLKSAWDQIRRMELSNEKKVQALKLVEAKLEENYSKLDYKRRKELQETEKKNRKEQKEHLELLKSVYQAIGDTTSTAAQDIAAQISSLEDQLASTEKKTSAQLKKDRKELAKDSKEYKDLTNQIKEAKKEEKEARREEAKEKTKSDIKKRFGINEDATGKDVIGQAISNAIAKISDSAKKSLEQAENILNTYRSTITARLEGSGKTYEDLSKVIRQNLSVSAITQQTKVLENLSRLVDSGIAYNVEQRAFLASVKDDIAKTFDAFDSNLAQMIRLQRDDSTYARLGLESSLQTFFNKNFLDTAYLSDMRKSVSGALIEAQATMNNNQAAEFEYIVQKWLGSLYSAGASSNLISQLAAGINMLGTGDVAGLSGSSMQTLFAMAANRAGLDYAGLLTSGLNAENTNKLLNSMVWYLSDIAKSTKDNRIVSGAYNTIFNMTQADLRAIRNISNDISTIYDSTLSYNQMQETTYNGISSIGSRLTLSARAKNVLENLKFSAASNLIESPITYLTLLATNAIEDLTGGVNIEAAPFGIGISAKMTDIIRSGLFGISFLSEVLGNLDKINNPGMVGDYFLNPYAAGEMRGTGYNLTSTSGVSQSYSAGGSSSDISSQSLKNAADQQAAVKQGIQNDTNETIAIDDIFYALVSEKGSKGNLSSLSASNSQLLDMLSKSFVTELGAQRVVITGFNLDGSNEMPIKFGQTGELQVINAGNLVSNSVKGVSGATLAYLITLLENILAGDDAINVNLKYSDVSMPGLVMGTETAPSQSFTKNNSPLVTTPNSPSSYYNYSEIPHYSSQ